MKIVVNMIQSKDYAAAKDRIKSRKALGYPYYVQKILSKYSRYWTDSQEAQLIRLMFHYDYLRAFPSTNDLVCQMECSVVECGSWDKINAYIEEAPLTINALGRLIVRIYDERNDKDARKVLMSYHKKYDVNKVNWPDEIRDSMQQMAAEIAILDSVSE